MAKRRAHGEGSIYQRGDGRWVGQLENGYYPSGERKRTRIVRKTQAEVVAEIQRRRSGGRVLDGSMRLDVFLDAWLEQLADVGGSAGRPVSDNTLRRYRWSAERVKAQRVAKMRLRDIRPRDIETCVGALRRSGLADSSVSDVKTALTTALGWAVRNDQLNTNPAREVRVHRTKRGKLDDKLSRDDVARVLTVAEDDAWGVAAVLGLKLGLRIGEVCGLRWSDVGTDELRIRRTVTKTDDGAGQLPLLDDVADALTARKRHQASEKLACPPGLWTDSGYIITGAHGQPVDPGTVRRWWNKLLKSAAVAHRCGHCDDPETACYRTIRRFHAARHTVASTLLDDGVPLEVVSAICRHSDIQITSNIYAEVTKDSMRRSLGKLAKASGA